MGIGATIRLWRGPRRVWPLQSLNGRFSVILDGSDVDDIRPKQIKVYKVSPGEHSLRLDYFGFLRRSGELHVSVAEGEEKQFVCFINAIGFAAVRPATPKDVAAMERWQSPPVTPPNLAEDDSR